MQQSECGALGAGRPPLPWGLGRSSVPWGVEGTGDGPWASPRRASQHRETHAVQRLSAPRGDTRECRPGSPHRHEKTAGPHHQFSF